MIQPQWISVFKRLPPPNPKNPGHSIWVLTYGWNGEISPISARYDFTRKMWFNDIILEEDSQEVIPTFWTEITTFKDNPWIDATAQMPEMFDKVSDYVLTCCAGPEYEASLVSAYYSLESKSLQREAGSTVKETADGQPAMPTTHWMPLPELPVEEDDEDYLLTDEDDIEDDDNDADEDILDED